VLVGFASFHPPCELDSRLRRNDIDEDSDLHPGVCRGAKLLCRGFGGVPQFPILPPRVGARGLKTSSETVWGVPKKEGK
jgi:hypothetical protein